VVLRACIGRGMQPVLLGPVMKGSERGGLVSVGDAIVLLFNRLKPGAVLVYQVLQGFAYSRQLIVKLHQS
jgi:hypothetical protein